MIENKCFDEERALYHLCDTVVSHCCFKGPKDGESVLKEGRRIVVDHCDFSLRYPLWHVDDFQLLFSALDEKTRAPIWYSHHGKIDHCDIDSIKALRECSYIDINNSIIDSCEMGWYSHHLNIKDCEIKSEYICLNAHHVYLENVKFVGKYAFQYMHQLEIVNCVLDTKDAFWHSEDVIVKDSVIKGEYLGWFSKNLTLVNCEIVGTQPFCYCDGLKLIDCKMVDTDLAFEYSDVNATIRGYVESIKNVKSGQIVLDDVGEVIVDEPIMEVNGQVIKRSCR